MDFVGWRDTNTLLIAGMQAGNSKLGELTTFTNTQQILPSKIPIFLPPSPVGKAPCPAPSM
jgi:hypothetical protein